MAMGKNQLDASVQNEVVAILYSLRGDVVRLSAAATPPPR